MNNKVLIKLTVPEINQKFDLFIPVNEIIWKIKKLIIVSIQDLCSCKLNDAEYILINIDNNRKYNNNEIVINTDIRNTTELMLIPSKYNS